LHPKRFSDGPDRDNVPYVIAANDAGLLLHVSWRPFLGFNGNGRATGTRRSVSPFPTTASPTSETSAWLRSPENRSKRVRDRWAPLSGSQDGADADGPSLYTFRSGASVWVRTDVGCNAWDWSDWDVLVHNVIAHGGNLWWVNLHCLWEQEIEI
jgi:hypothetical protein